MSRKKIEKNTTTNKKAKLMTNDEIVHLLAAYYKNTGSLDGMYWILNELKKYRNNRRLHEQRLTTRALALSHDITIKTRKKSSS